ncbi:MAG: phosphate ABC transporter permease PstA [Salinisphaeraceae bacterium]
MAEAAIRIHRTAGAAGRDRWLACGAWISAILVAAVFVWLLSDLLRQGLGELSWSFLSGPVLDAGRDGGIGPIIVSSLLILGVCLAAVIPLGLAAAIWLAEYTRREDHAGATVRRSLDVLAGVPSIVFGLFGNAFFCVFLGMGYSIAAGGLTLACMVLPLFIRATEQGLAAVPDSYRAAGAAAGLRRHTLLRVILLPAAMPGMVVGLVLGIGRALAETAALLFTSGYVTRLPDSLGDSGRALSIHIYDLSMNVSGSLDQAFSTALVLISLLLVINLAAGLVGRRLQQRALAVQ